MKSQPVIDLPKSQGEIWLDVAAWLFAGLGLALAIGYYDGLPEQIPTHFNASGVADKFGSRNTIFLLPVLAVVVSGGLIWLLRYPHKFNYLTKITPENAALEYRRMRFMLRALNALTNLLFLVITWDVLQAAINGNGKLSLLFWIVFILLMVAPPVLLLAYKPAPEKAGNRG